jgi:hypothetical protein
LEGGGLTVEVSDPVWAFPKVGMGADGQEGGRGFLVVAQLAAALD